MAEKAQFLLAHENNRYFIKINGPARYSNCSAFGSFVLDQLLKDDSCEDVLVDLSNTQLLDSTNLGLLAKIAGFIVSRYKHKMTVISTDKNINDLLVNTGFEQLMLIIEKPDSFARQLEELPSISAGEKNLAKMMFEAHKELMELNDENEKQFRPAVELLKNEVEKNNPL